MHIDVACIVARTSDPMGAASSRRPRTLPAATDSGIAWKLLGRPRCLDVATSVITLNLLSQCSLISDGFAFQMSPSSSDPFPCLAIELEQQARALEDDWYADGP